MSEVTNRDGRSHGLNRPSAPPAKPTERISSGWPVRLARQDLVELYLEQLRRRAGWSQRPRA